jgi:N-acetylglucosamine kinase
MSELLNNNIKCKIYIGNDTLAPIFTAFKNGGIVVISGTGSNCVLINPLGDDETNDQEKFGKKIESFDQIKCTSSGGWGNLLGDEGSAYWIAQKAIKYLIDFTDNFLVDEHLLLNDNDINMEMDELKEIIFDHFKVNIYCVDIAKKKFKNKFVFFY